MRGTIAQEQEQFIRAFNAIGDWLLQYDFLLALYADLPLLPQEQRTDDRLVPGCVSRLWLDCRLEQGRVRLSLAADALISGAIAGVIVRLLDDRSPAEILETRLDVLTGTPLREELSADRFRGMEQVIGRIIDFAWRQTGAGRDRAKSDGSSS